MAADSGMDRTEKPTSKKLADARKKPRLCETRPVRTTCPYCGTGCGMILGVRGGQIVWVDGDPDSPVNRGRLCVKGRWHI